MATFNVGRNVFDKMFPKVTARALTPHADLATRARPEALEAPPHINKAKRVALVTPAIEEQPIVIPVYPTLHHNIT